MSRSGLGHTTTPWQPRGALTLRHVGAVPHTATSQLQPSPHAPLRSFPGKQASGARVRPEHLWSCRSEMHLLSPARCCPEDVWFRCWCRAGTKPP